MPVSEAAVALKVSRQRIYQLVEAGLLVGRKYNTTWLISVGSVEARIALLGAEERSCSHAR